MHHIWFCRVDLSTNVLNSKCKSSNKIVSTWDNLLLSNSLTPQNQMCDKLFFVWFQSIYFKYFEFAGLTDYKKSLFGLIAFIFSQFRQQNILDIIHYFYFFILILLNFDKNREKKLFSLRIKVFFPWYDQTNIDKHWQNK